MGKLTMAIFNSYFDNQRVPFVQKVVSPDCSQNLRSISQLVPNGLLQEKVFRASFPIACCLVNRLQDVTRGSKLMNMLPANSLLNSDIALFENHLYHNIAILKSQYLKL